MPLSARELFARIVFMFLMVSICGSIRAICVKYCYSHTNLLVQWKLYTGKIILKIYITFRQDKQTMRWLIGLFPEISTQVRANVYGITILFRKDAVHISPKQEQAFFITVSSTIAFILQHPATLKHNCFQCKFPGVQDIAYVMFCKQI